MRSQNELSSLPPDFFENMPSLTNVHLDQNKFITLSEKPFSGAISNLQQLWMTGNIYFEYSGTNKAFFTIFNCNKTELF